AGADDPTAPLGHLDQSREIGLREQDDELFAAIPGHDIATPHGSKEAAGNLNQDPVAGLMAVAVVDPLEVVDVDDEEADAAVVPGRTVDLDTEHLFEEATVVEVGQPVGDDQPLLLA